MTTLPRIWAGARKAQISRLAAIGLLQSLFGVSIALLTKAAFDQWILGRAALDSVLPYAALFVLAVAVLLMLRVAERVGAERLGQDYVHELRGTLFDYIASIDDADLRRLRSGAVALRFIGDLSALRIWISQGQARLVVTGINLALTLSALIVMQWQLGLLVGAVMGASLAVCVFLGRGLRESVRTVRRRRSQLAANIGEKIAGMASVRAFGGVRRERKRLLKQSARLRDAMVRRARWVGFFRAVAEGGSQAAIGLALLAGGLLAAAGEATPGAIVAAVSVVTLLSAPMRGLARTGEYWHNARVAREKLETYLGRYPIAASANAARRVRRGDGRLTLRDVCPPFANARLNVRVPAGSVIAVTGDNGAGKSTLLSLLARLATPQGGTILLDGRDLAAIREKSYRQAVGMAGERLPLLKGTIDANIRYRCPAAGKDEIADAVRRAGLEDWLDRLPLGLDTVVAENGANFSLGERKRIELARAIIGEPKLLLLDEPEQGLDKTSRAVLYRLIDEYPGTVVVATQDRRLLAAADEIWVMEAGGIARRESVPEKRSGSGANVSWISPQ